MPPNEGPREDIDDDRFAAPDWTTIAQNTDVTSTPPTGIPVGSSPDDDTDKR